MVYIARPLTPATNMDVMSSIYTATNAAAYERLMGRWSRVLAMEFLKFVAIAPGAPVIDIGCGTGSLASALASGPMPASVLGLDISPAYIAYAGRRPEGGAGAAFVVGDARALPVASSTCGAALSLFALHFVSGPEHAVAEMVRVTRPGGVVGAAVWDFTGGLVYQRLFWDTAAALDPAAERARAKHYGNLLTQSGALARAFAEARLTGI